VILIALCDERVLAGDEAWILEYRPDDLVTIVPTDLLANPDGSFYVCGACGDSSRRIIAGLFKIGRWGHVDWDRRFGSESGEVRAVAMCADRCGGVYVTGSIDQSAVGEFPHNVDIVTLHYDSRGRLIWHTTYDAGMGGHDVPSAITCDRYGNVYITGSAHTEWGGEDCVTLKYTPFGKLAWSRTYDGGWSHDDWGVDIAVDRHGNVVVAGGTFPRPRDVGGNGDDFLLLKYDRQGELLWESYFDGTAHSDDYVLGLGVGPDDAIYVGGNAVGSMTGTDMVAVCFTPQGNQAWATRYDGIGAEGNNPPRHAVIDRFGNTYLTGHVLEVDPVTLHGGYRFTSIRISSLGQLEWASVKPLDGDRLVEGTVIAVHENGDVFVTGTGWRTIGYDNSGNITHTFKHPMSGSDAATCMAIGAYGTVVMAGGDSEGRMILIAYNTDRPNGNVANESVSALCSYPNPFNASMTIEFLAVRPGRYQVDVFNTLGQHIDHPFEGELAAGIHRIRWGVSSRTSTALPSGVYYYRVSSSDRFATGNAVLLK